MKKYFLKPGTSGMVSVEPETMDISMVEYCRTGIDWIYEVPEDGTLSVNDTDIQNMPVNKGNIVILFYSDYGLKHRAVIIDNKEWEENIEAYKAKQLEDAKKYANEAKCCGDCETCDCKAA